MTKIEEVEKQLEVLSYQVSRKSVGANVSFQESLVNVLAIIRPTLEWVEGFIFTPKRWKKAIRKIIQILDAIQSTSSVTFEA